MSLPQALQELGDILKREKEAGKKRVAISPEALATLREIPNVPATPPPAAALEPKSEPVSLQPVAAEPVAAPPTETREEKFAEKTPPPESVSQLANLIAPDLISVDGETKRDRLNNLFRALKADKSTQLPTLLSKLVFAKGDTDADVMFVGEAPGAEEEQQRKPFVGPSGQLLDKIIGATGIGADKVYISNIVKYRPKIGDGTFQGTKNRKPDPDEMSAHLRYVLTEIDIVRPKVIIALGGTAAEGLLGLAGSVSKMRGQFFEVQGVPTRVTYHPSFLLRAAQNGGGKPEKRKVWEDFLTVMELLEMEVTERQRGFFL